MSRKIVGNTVGTPLNPERIKKLIGDGKTAYQYAKDGGYAGTEAEFAKKMAAEYLPADTVIPAPYTLPPATADTLGGIKVGKGLQIMGDVLEVVPECVWELIDEITFSESAALSVSQEPDGTPYKFARMLLVCDAPAGEGNPNDVSAVFSGTVNTLPIASWSGSNTASLAHYGEIGVKNGYWRSQWGTNTNFYVWTNVNLIGYKRILGFPISNAAYRYIAGLRSTGVFRAGSVLSIYGIRYKEG